MQKRKRTNKKYSPEFKLSVILDTREHHLGYSETMRKYFPLLQSKNFGFLQKWERIYLEEGDVELTIERRGRGTKMDNPKKGRPRKKPLDKEIKNDLIAENQRLKEENEYLRAECEYLKKFDALIRKELSQNNFLNFCLKNQKSP